MVSNKESRISIRVEKADKEILENYAFMNDCTITDIIFEAVRAFLKNQSMFETSKERKGKLWMIN